jgi:hypothetical protein
MSEEHHGHADLISFIDAHRKAGTTDEQITVQLLQAGWPLDQVTQALAHDAPTPDPAVQNNMSAQTGNAGTPMQVENVSYNMRMKPVQSKVGLYIKFAGVGLWLTAFFVSGFFASLIQQLSGSDQQLGQALVFTLSLSVVTVPIFLIAYSKFRAEMKKNPADIDDIFFKQSVRRGLWFNVVIGAIAAVVTVYQLLSTLFLPDNGTTYASSLSALCFTLGFGGVVYFYWRLHALTRR